MKTAAGSTLAEFSGDFGPALARLRDAQEDVLVTLDEVAARWLEAVQWPSDQLVRGLSTRLVVMVGWASRAIEKKNPLYCWFGPAVPGYVIVSGTGMDEYETYRRNRRR